MKRQQIQDLLILLLILLVGGILRFYKLPGIPMTHDELSAFYRLDFSHLKELIKFGVLEDGHPAGIQIFLFYWTKLFGTGDIIVKLPFLLMGMGSILLAYKVSERWFNRTSALFVAAYMASLQFSVMFSQIARPYIGGLFFCLLMVLFWTSLVFDTNKKRYTSSLGFILSAAACCYIHHFSLLFTAIVSLTGLFYLKKENRVPYILALLAIVLLYIPHLKIFFYQLNKGGLEWLGIPENSFILDYVKYIFHFNTLVYTLTIVLLFLGIYTNSKRAWPINKFQFISLIWFLVPPIIGFFYSKYISPVVQFSMLIFSFPFLLIFLFSFFKPSGKWHKILIVSVILFINISTLIWSRQHYDIFYKQPFNRYASLTQEFIANHDAREVSIVFQENPIYINHYFAKLNPGLEYISIFDRNLTPFEFEEIISSKQSEYLICGGIPLEYIPIVKEYYPQLLSKEFGFTYEYYIFSKNNGGPKEAANDAIIFSEKMNFESERENWQTSGCLEEDLSLQAYCSLDSSQEWGPKYENSLLELTGSKNDIIDIALDYKNDYHGQIVCAIMKDSELLFWQSRQLKNYYDPAKDMEWQQAYHSIRLRDIFRKDRDMQDCSISIYYWNNEESNIILDNFNIEVREGNEKIYSLFSSI